MSACRMCKSDDEGGLVKYAVRHRAHVRCLIVARVGLGAELDEAIAVLDSLPYPQLYNLRPIADFDAEEIKGTFGAVGMTTGEFMEYFRKRQKANDAATPPGHPRKEGE